MLRTARSPNTQQSSDHRDHHPQSILEAGGPSGDAAAERTDVSKIVNSAVKISVFLFKQCVFCGI